jgi:hypothetical protein
LDGLEKNDTSTYLILDSTIQTPSKLFDRLYHLVQFYATNINGELYKDLDEMDKMPGFFDLVKRQELLNLTLQNDIISNDFQKICKDYSKEFKAIEKDALETQVSLIKLTKFSGKKDLFLEPKYQNYFLKEIESTFENPEEYNKLERFFKGELKFHNFVQNFTEKAPKNLKKPAKILATGITNIQRALNPWKYRTNFEGFAFSIVGGVMLKSTFEAQDPVMMAWAGMLETGCLMALFGDRKTQAKGYKLAAYGNIISGLAGVTNLAMGLNDFQHGNNVEGMGRMQRGVTELFYTASGLATNLLRNRELSTEAPKVKPSELRNTALYILKNIKSQNTFINSYTLLNRNNGR